jgi:zinc protease
VVMAWPGLTLADPRVPTMEVLTSVLGGQAGRLFVALREDEGLVYHTAASSSEGLDAGHVAFYAASSPDKLVRAEAALERERARIFDEPATAVELDRAKAWLVGQAEAALQRRGRVASLLAFDEVYGLGYAAHRRYAQRIDRVKAADVLALARALLHPTRRITTIVSG